MYLSNLKLTALINLQASKYVTERSESIKLLNKKSQSEAKNIIKKSLNDTDSSVRCVSVRAISKWPEHEAFDLLEHCFTDDPSPRVRVAIVQGISFWDGDRTQKLLLLALQDKEPKVRAAAADCLFNKSHLPNILNALLPVLSDYNYSVRDFARRALLKASELYNKHPPPSDVQKIVEQYLDHENTEVRLRVALAMCRWQLPMIRRNLLEGYHTSVKELRLACLNGLSGWDDEDAYRFIISALNDEDDEIRAFATWSLGKFEPTPDSVDVLLHALADHSSIVVVNAQKTLGQWHDLHTLRKLHFAMFFGSIPIRKSLRPLMREWGDPMFLRIIIDEVFEEHHQNSQGRHQLWQYRHPLMFKAFSLAIQNNLRTQRIIQIVGPWNLIDAVALVTKVLEHDCYMVRLAAREALSRWTNAEIPMALINLLMHEQNNDDTSLKLIKNTRDINAQEVLIAALDHDDSRIQKRAVDTILAWNQPEVMAKLEHKLTDTNQLLSIRVMKLFSGYRHPFLLEFWIKALSSRKAEVSALAIRELNSWRDEDTLAKLILCLQQKEHYVFKNASAALSGWRCTTISEALVDAVIAAIFRDPNLSSWTPADKKKWQYEYPYLSDMLCTKLAQIDRIKRWKIYSSFFYDDPKPFTENIEKLIYMLNLNYSRLRDLVVHRFIPNLKLSTRVDLLQSLALRNPDSIRTQLKQSIAMQDLNYIAAVDEVICAFPEVAKTLELCGIHQDSQTKKLYVDVFQAI